MESNFVDLDGPVHFLDHEGPPEGPTFVLVHGLGGSHTNWLSVASALAPRGRVLVLDLAGFGRTPLAGRSATIQANQALLDRFIGDIVGAPVVLVGNSMGGTIAIMQACDHKDTVAGLVLINPALPRAARQPVDPTILRLFATYMVPVFAESFVESRLRRLGPERLTMETIRMCTVDASRVDPVVLEAQIELARERMESMPWATKAFLQAARSLVRAGARKQEFFNKIRSITAPTLLIAGRRDRLVPIAAVEAVARLRPDWEFVVFDDIGHVPMLEDPVSTLGAIEGWLAATRLHTSSILPGQ